MGFSDRKYHHRFAYALVVVCSGSHEKKVNLGEVFSRTPSHNIVVVCSGSHEKKVNLGEVFSFGEVFSW
jgi:hypothetical protein